MTLLPSIGLCLAIAIYTNKGGRKKWNLKRNVLVKSIIFGFLISLVISLLRIINPTHKEVQTISEGTEISKKPAFQKSKDSLNIMILSFYSPDDLNNSNCVGESIFINLTNDSLVNSLPINIIYDSTINPPRNTTESEQIREFNQADILIHGIYDKNSISCSKLNVCFQYSFNNDLSKELNSIKTNYSNSTVFQETSAQEIIEGKFSAEYKAVAKWLVSTSYFKLKQYNKCIEILESLTSDYEKTDEAIIQNLAISYNQIKNNEKCIEIINQNTNSLTPKTLLTKVYCLNNIGRYKEALSLLDSISAIDSHIRISKKHLKASLLKNVGRYEESNKIYDGLIRIGYYKGHFDKAWNYDYMDQYDDLRKEIDLYLMKTKRKKDSIQALGFRSMCSYEKRDFKNTIQDRLLMIDLGEKDKYTFIYLINSYLEIGDRINANKVNKKALSIFSKEELYGE